MSQHHAISCRLPIGYIGKKIISKPKYNFAYLKQHSVL